VSRERQCRRDLCSISLQPRQVDADVDSVHSQKRVSGRVSFSQSVHHYNFDRFSWINMRMRKRNTVQRLHLSEPLTRQLRRNYKAVKAKAYRQGRWVVKRTRYSCRSRIVSRVTAYTFLRKVSSTIVGIFPTIRDCTRLYTVRSTEYNTTRHGQRTTDNARATTGSDGTSARANCNCMRGICAAIWRGCPRRCALTRCSSKCRRCVVDVLPMGRHGQRGGGGGSVFGDASIVS
jgi:hypothetical protein